MGFFWSGITMNRDRAQACHRLSVLYMKREERVQGLRKPEEKDGNQASPWAVKAWEEAKANGYLDGTKPKEPLTREEGENVDVTGIMNELNTSY